MIIKLKNLHLKTIIGIHKWEDDIERKMLVNIEIETDHTKSMKSDNIKDTIDYDLIANDIKNLVKNNRFKLVERMADEILNLIMANTKVKKCKLEIDKIGAVADLDSFSITDIRERK
jgi:FolB domain-containing protein